MKLQGKTAVVTGAGRGMGEAIAKRLALEGAKVACCDKVEDSLKTVVEEILASGGEARGFTADVTKREEIEMMVSSFLEQYGKIDILINNAGVSRSCKFVDITEEQRDFHFDINIKGVWNMAQIIIPSMIRQKYGRIINFSSVTGPLVVDPGMTAYATTKAAVYGFTKALAIEMAPYNITVNAIMPGYILTPLVQRHPQEALDGIAARVPLGRLGTTEEIANLVSFLASDESSYITGTAIVIDGGNTLTETGVLGTKNGG